MLARIQRTCRVQSLARWAILACVLVLATMGTADARGVSVYAGARPIVPSSLKLGCPSPPGDPGGPSLILTVTHWCGLKAPHSQWQIKIQLRIDNTGTKSLPLGLEHIRLAVTHFNPLKWHSPGTGGQRPFKATFQGRRYWFIPANADGLAESFPPPKGNFTFATHWGAPKSLKPGKAFRPKFHVGDAVFYMPRSKKQTKISKLPGVGGIAYVDGPHVIDLCDPANWPAKVPASSF